MAGLEIVSAMPILRYFTHRPDENLDALRGGDIGAVTIFGTETYANLAYVYGRMIIRPLKYWMVSFFCSAHNKLEGTPA